MTGARESVVVVGAGPVGLTLAVELARRDVPVRVVDADAGPSTTSKAIGIHARTLETLERAGVTDRLLDLGLPIRSFRFHDRTRLLAELPFAELPSAYPFALSLGQEATERVLLDRLRETGVEVEWGTRVVSLQQQGDEVHVTLDEGADLDRSAGRAGVPSEGGTGRRSREVRAAWVVGCDGASSTVRRQTGIGFDGEPFPEWFLVADLVVDGAVVTADAGDRPTNLFLSEVGATALFPLPEPGLHRLATPLPQPAAPADTPAAGHGETPRDAPVVDLPVIERLWADRVGRPAAFSDPRWISPFRFHSRLASHYRRGRVFLAGDAAHVHSPVGGHGMNTGMHDAVDLAWKLAAVRCGAPRALLDTYEAERRPVAARVLHESRRTAVLASASSRAAGAARATGLRLVTGVRPVRRRFLATVTMLAASSPGAALPGSPPGPSTADRLRGAPHAGQRAPDATVTRDGQPVRLHSLLATRGHVLLTFDAGRPAHESGPGVVVIAGGSGGHDGVDVVAVRAGPPGAVDAGPSVEVHDPDGRAHAAYAARGPVAVLVRPDGTIGWRGPATPAGTPSLRAVLDATLPRRDAAGSSAPDAPVRSET